MSRGQRPRVGGGTARRTSSMETVLVFLLAGMMLSGCVLFVVVLSPAFLWVGVVAGGIFAMAGLHYLLWGRFVRGMLEREEEEEVEGQWWEVERIEDERARGLGD